MLKKYGIGLMALMLSLAVAAFTTTEPKHASATHVFEFDSSLPYDMAHVTDPANWLYVGELAQNSLCSGTNKACRIAVSDSYVDDPANPLALTNVSISAQKSGTGDARITGITGAPVSQFSNQP